MKFVIHPAVEPERLAALRAEAPAAEWVNAADAADGRWPRCPGPTPSSARSRPSCSPGPTASAGSRRSRPAWSTTSSPSWSRTPAP